MYSNLKQTLLNHANLEISQTMDLLCHLTIFSQLILGTTSRLFIDSLIIYDG